MGRRFDAQWLSPTPGCTLDVALRSAASPAEALAKAFALGGPSDVAAVWVDGERLGASDRVAAPV